MNRPRQFSDEEILATARACLLEHGPSVATSKIALAVGLSESAIFKRFGTKENLVAHALVPPVPGFIDVVNRGPDERPAHDQLVEIACEIAAFFEEMVPLMAMLHACNTHPFELLKRHDVPPPILGLRAMVGWMQRGSKSGLIGPCDPNAASRALLGGLQSRAFFQMLDPSEKPSKKTRSREVVALVDVVLNGIAPKEESA